MPSATSMATPTRTSTSNHARTSTATPNLDSAISAKPTFTLTPTVSPSTEQRSRATVLFGNVAVYQGPMGDQFGLVSTVSKDTPLFICAGVTDGRNAKPYRYLVALDPCDQGRHLGWVSVDTVSPPVPLLPDIRMTRVPTITPTPQPTSTLSPTPILTPRAKVTAEMANVRAGPGTAYPIVGSARMGDSLNIVGKDAKMPTWWQVCCIAGGKAWVRTDLVGTIGPVEMVPVVAAPPPPTPTRTPTVLPSPIVTIAPPATSEPPTKQPEPTSTPDPGPPTSTPDPGPPTSTPEPKPTETL